MHHFAVVLCAGLVATVVVGGDTPAEAAKTPSAEAVAVKETTAAFRDQVQDKKIRWAGRRQGRGGVAVKETTAAGRDKAKEKKIRGPASRKFVSDCVAKTVKLTPA